MIVINRTSDSKYLLSFSVSLTSAISLANRYKFENGSKFRVLTMKYKL